MPLQDKVKRCVVELSFVPGKSSAAAASQLFSSNRSQERIKDLEEATRLRLRERYESAEHSRKSDLPKRTNLC